MFHKNITTPNDRGLLIYTHHSLNPEETSITSNFEENLWIEINLHKNDKLLVGVIYRSENGRHDNNEELLNLMQTCSSTKHSHKLIMGDFNYKDINWKSLSTKMPDTSNEKKFLNCVKDTFLYQQVENFTRSRTGQQPSLIDLIFTNEENMINDITHLSPIGKSDHGVMVFNFNCYKNKNHTKEGRRNFNNGNYEDISKFLDRNWENEFKDYNNDTEKQWNHLCNILNESIERWIPIKPESNNNIK